MSKKVIKYIFELTFIFLIPLLFVAIGFKKEKSITLNDNDVATKEDDYLSWEYPFSDYKDNNHYINKLDYNMKITNLKQSSYYNRLSSVTNAIQIIDYGSLLSVDLINLNITQGHIIYFKYSGVTAISGGPSLFIYWYNGSLYEGINYYSNYFYGVYNNSSSTNNIQIRIDNEDYVNKIISFYCYDLTEMFGQGYEPSVQEFESILSNFNIDNNLYVDSMELTFYTQNSEISSNWQYNYTNLAKVYHGLLNGLHLNDITVTRVVLFYTVIWLIQFFVWHLVYRLFDKIFHIRKD